MLEIFLVEINTGVRKGCSHSPALFNIPLHFIIAKWYKEDITGIPLSKYQQLLKLKLNKVRTKQCLDLCSWRA